MYLLEQQSSNDFHLNGLSCTLSKYMNMYIYSQKLIFMLHRNNVNIKRFTKRANVVYKEIEAMLFFQFIK